MFDLARNTLPLVVVSLRPVLAAVIGGLFSFAIVRSVHFTAAFVLDNGRAPAVAIAYATFIGRMLATAAFFVLAMTLFPKDAPATAAGFVAVIVAAPLASLVRLSSPRRMRSKGGIH